MSTRQHRPMVYVVWSLVILLIVLHQDNRFWEDPALVWGFLPVSLLYHMAISCCAAAVWYLATRYAWPVCEQSSDESAVTPWRSRGDRS